MNHTRWLRRASLAGLVALAAVATAGPASAQTFSYIGGPVTYATQAVQSTGTVLTASHTTVITELAPAGAIPPTSTNITLTLPAGFTFTNAPTVSCAPGSTTTTCSVTGTGSPVGSSTFTFTVNYIATGAGTSSALFIGVPGAAFNFSNATALQAPTAALLLNASSTDPNWVVASGANTPFAASASALNFVTSAPATPLFGVMVIDVGTTGLGKQFIQGASSNPDTLLADIGGLTLGTSGTSPTDATGVTAFSFGGAPATITLAGVFNGIASAYLAPQNLTSPVTTCAATAPAGSFPGTVAATTIIVPNVPIIGPGPGVVQEICLTASGTSLIGPNLLPPAATASVGSFADQTAPAPTLLDIWNYNGSVQQILYSGSFTGYPLFERITNNTNQPVTTVVAVQPDTGAGGVATLTALPGNSNVLVPVTTGIIVPSGVTLDTTGRANLLFLTKGAICVNNAGGPTCEVSVSQFWVNPGGVITLVGDGATP
jgi:hypothetical protein